MFRIIFKLFFSNIVEDIIPIILMYMYKDIKDFMTLCLGLVPLSIQISNVGYRKLT